MVKNFKMIKADQYFVDTLKEIIYQGDWDKNPRPKWDDNSPAHSKFVTQKFFKYDINKGEFPIITFRKTALKAAFHDIEAIYIKQTNILEDMHPSIHSWWKDFSRKVHLINDGMGKPYKTENLFRDKYDTELEREYHTLGKTYGAIIKKYALMDKLLKGLEENPFSRRHIIDMWQYQEQENSPNSLHPCAFQTLWSVRKKMERTESSFKDKDGEYKEIIPVRYVDLTLIQRSMDFLVTASINPSQYVMLGLMVCNHLTYHTGIVHKLDNFFHFIQNCHIYDRHIHTAEYLLGNVEPIEKQPTIELIGQPKDFYLHTIDDFRLNIPKNIKDLPEKLEIAV